MSPHKTTQAVRAGIDRDRAFGAVVPPLHLSTNYSFESFGVRREYDYTRSGNPTRDELARALASLEGGAGAVVTASGMAALTLVLARLPAGARVAAPADGYGGTWRLLRALERQEKIVVDLVDFRDTTARRAAFERRPSLVILESPTNPLLRIVDIEAICTEARAAGAKIAVDNTFLSPARQNPLALGADLVVHSTTKYVAGHSDVVAGAVIARERAEHEDLLWWANCLGLTGAPFDAWLTLRGLRTLSARMAVHERNAAAIAAFLVRSPAVAKVHYPGLSSHSDHALAARQQSGFGGIVSFELRGGAFAAARFVAGLQLFTLAESLGGVESLVAHPATMTHAAMTEEARAAAGIAPGLLRLSVGIEEDEDLLHDLGAALHLLEAPNPHVEEAREMEELKL